MKSSVLRAGLLLIGLAFGLGACLSSDAPNLAAEDLTEPAQFAGTFFATDFPEEKSDKPAIDATVEAIGDRSYRLTFAEGDHKDAPVIVRVLTLNDGTLLGVFTDPDPSKGAMYGTVTHAANGSWVFRMIDLPGDRLTRSVREALMRHGAQAVTFTSGAVDETHITGKLTAANLRALFSDSAFTPAIESTKGFRLSPKGSEVSGIALQ